MYSLVAYSYLAPDGTHVFTNSQTPAADAWLGVFLFQFWSQILHCHRVGVACTSQREQRQYSLAVCSQGDKLHFHHTSLSAQGQTSEHTRLKDLSISCTAYLPGNQDGNCGDLHLYTAISAREEGYLTMTTDSKSCCIFKSFLEMRDLLLRIFAFCSAILSSSSAIFW